MEALREGLIKLFENYVIITGGGTTPLFRMQLSCHIIRCVCVFCWDDIGLQNKEGKRDFCLSFMGFGGVFFFF